MTLLRPCASLLRLPAAGCTRTFMRKFPHTPILPRRAAAATGLALAALLAAACVQAADTTPPKHSLFVSVVAGTHAFDGSSPLADDRHAGASLAFRFSDRHSLELSAGRTDTLAAASAARYDSRRLDALWHYFRGASWQPYVLSGIGEDEYSGAGGRDDRGTFANGGAGVFRHLGGPIHLRAEVRAQYQFDEDTWHGIAVLGLTGAFGGPYAGPAASPP